MKKLLHPKIIAFVALAALFLIYANHRQRYIGACDWYGYYEEARLFTQGRLTMPLGYDLHRFPAAVPLAYYASEGRALPQYPPGFPLLLAAAMPFKLEFFVTPLCAVLSVLLLYLLLRRRVGRFTAVLISTVWAFTPIVIWGAGNVMSDLPAALALMACYYFFEKEWYSLSGLTFAFAVMIRPTNFLFGLLLLPLLLKSFRLLWRFAWAAGLLGGIYGIYNWYMFGAPWRTGYTYFSETMSRGVFFQHFLYYGWEMVLRFSPLLVIAALWALWRRRPRTLFLLAWALVFWLFYSFWIPGADAWWYARFLLPGFPPVFLLAADGWEDLRNWAARRRQWLSLAVHGAMIAAVIGIVAHSVDFTRKQAYFRKDLGKVFYDVAANVRQVVPAGALIGSFDMSGALRLYGGYDTFFVLRPDCIRLIRYAMRSERPVYILMEPGVQGNSLIERIAMHFKFGPPIAIPAWDNTYIVKLLRERKVVEPNPEEI